LALMLLAGAALLVQSATRLANVDRGFVAHGVLTFELQPPLASHRAPAARARLYQRIQSELAQLPGVTSVGLSHRLPLSGNSGIGLRIAGRPTPAPDEIPQINYRSVSSGYWKALGVPIVRGRVFTDAEAWERGAVAVINQAAARQFFADSDPIGQRLIIGPQSQFPEIEIIGIVADSRDASLRGPAEPMLFAPYIAMPVPAMTVIVRTSIDPATLTAAAARAVARVDGQLPIAHVQTLDRFMDDVLAQPRFTSALASLFAILALVLAAIGVYGVIAVLVAARTREIGIRLALGADPRQIVRRILSEGLRVATAGIALGIVAALLLGRLLADLLYEVTPTDPATLAAAAATLLAIAVLATIVPARRTLRIDPVRALRE
jgi:putative ABC transport system permease protein